MYKQTSIKEKYDKFFYPESVAIVGASDDINKIGGYLFSETKKAISKVYPINVKGGIVQGNESYKRITDVHHRIDLAVIAIPGAFVLDAVLDCVKAGIKNIIIISAGFKETGDEGREKEIKLKKIIKEHNLNVIGPNCLGILNAEIEFNSSFAKDLPEKGGVALISQSGAVIDAIIDWSFKKKIGFSKIVSIGNMAGVDQLYMLEYLKDDDKTNAIVFYMETLERGEEFAKLMQEVSKKKPVIIIKPGTSEKAQKAIGSHTGSLAQNNVLVETLISENNGILVKNLNELFNVLVGLKANMPKNENIVILTNAGGPGVISTDEVANTNFEMKVFKEGEKSKFDFLPAEASVNNPIDILGDAKSDRYEKSLHALEKLNDVQNVFVLLTPQIMTDSYNIAKSLVDFSKKSEKCIFSCFLGDKEIKDALVYFDDNEFANFETPFDGLTAMNYLLDYNCFDYKQTYRKYVLDEKKVENIKNKLKDEKGLLSFERTKEIMEVFAIKLPEKQVLKSSADIEKIEIEKDKKYVLKGDGKGLVHKKELGGIVLGVSKDNFKEKISNMFFNLSKESNDVSITVEEEVSGIEVIVGLTQNGNLGNFIMFGMGGTYVNVVGDVNFSTCPLSEQRALKLIEKSKVYKLLKGYRDLKPVNIEHLKEILIRISHLQEIFPEIKEVDLNPVMCSDKGIYLVDVKLIL